MPNIRDAFSAGNLALRPSETGVEAAAAAGRRVGAFYNQLGAGEQELGRTTQVFARDVGQVGRETEQLGAFKGREISQVGRAIGSSVAAAGDAATDYISHSEISKGHAAYAGLLDAKTQQWNGTVAGADPNDPSIAPNFRAGLESDFDQLKSQFHTEKGQQFADAQAAIIRNHFLQTTTADMSTLAGQAIQLNNNRSLNSLSSAAYNAPSQSSLDSILAQYETGLLATVNTSPNLKGTAAAKVRDEQLQLGRQSIIKSAVIGAINQSGKMPDWINDPKYASFVNGTELKLFEKQAQVQQRTDLAYKKSIDAYNRTQAEAKATAAVTKAYTDNVTIDDQTGRPIIKPDYFKDVLAAVRANPDAPNAATAARTYFNWGESQLARRGGAIQSDPATKQALADGMMSPDKPTSEVDLMQAQIDGKLSHQDFAQMLPLVKALKTEPMRDPAFKAATDAAKSLLGTDPVGKGKAAAFMVDFMPQYMAAKRAGTATTADLDVNNPDSMISKAMQPYRRDAATLMTDRAMHGATVTISGTPPPAQPLPPKDQLEKNKVYQTAHGNMRWNGTGFVAP